METNFLTSLVSGENPFNTLKNLANYKALPDQNKVAMTALKVIEVISRVFAELARGLAIALIGTAVILGAAASLPLWGVYFIFNVIASKGPMQAHTMGTEQLPLTQETFDQHCDALINNKRHVKLLTIHNSSAVPFPLTDKNLEQFNKMLAIVAPEELRIDKCEITKENLEALDKKHDLRIFKEEEGSVTLKKVQRHDMMVNLNDEEGYKKSMELFKSKDYRIKNLFVKSSKEEAIEVPEELAIELGKFMPKTIHLDNCKLPLIWHVQALQAAKLSVQLSVTAA